MEKSRIEITQFYEEMSAFKESHPVNYNLEKEMAKEGLEWNAETGVLAQEE